MPGQGVIERPGRANSGTPSSASRRAMDRDSVRLRNAEDLGRASEMLLSRDDDELPQPGHERHQAPHSGWHRRPGVTSNSHSYMDVLASHSCIGRMKRSRHSVRDVLPEKTLAAGPVKLRQGDPRMRRVRLGLFAAGLATFALLYAPQPVLPMLAASFGCTPALPASRCPRGLGRSRSRSSRRGSAVSRCWDGGRVMIISLLAAALLAGWWPRSPPRLASLVVIRVVQGVALAGVPATGMAYLAEEVSRDSLGRAMGLYVARQRDRRAGAGGSSAEYSRTTAAGESPLPGSAARRCYARSRSRLSCRRQQFFAPAPPRLRAMTATLRRNLADIGLLRLYLIGFALMGGFSSVYK